MRNFDYLRVSSIDEAVRAKAANPAARFLGGGTNLIDLMKYEVEKADQLIDVSRLPLTRVEPLPGGAMAFGA